VPGLPAGRRALGEGAASANAADVKHVERQRYGEEEKYGARPGRRVLDLVSLGMEEHGGAGGRRYRECSKELRRCRVAHLQHPRNEPARRRRAIVRILGVALGEPQLLPPRFELEQPGQKRSRHKCERRTPEREPEHEDDDAAVHGMAHPPVDPFAAQTRMFARQREWSECSAKPSNAKREQNRSAHSDGNPDGLQWRLGSTRPARTEEPAGDKGAEQQGLQDDPALTSRAERRHGGVHGRWQAVSVRRGRRRSTQRVLTSVAILRAPHLYQCLRAFCLAAFSVERGAELPFAFEEHPTQNGPSLYEYRPLVRGFIEDQAPTLRRLPDTRNAIDDLRREPAAAMFAHAHAHAHAHSNAARSSNAADDALFRTILLPMLAAVAERCGGFDWNDEAFDSSYGEIERSLFGTARSYAAVAPLIGLSAGSVVELGGDIRMRPLVPGEVSSLWPEARGLMPPEFGRDVDRMCVLELARELDAADAEPPDAAGELADAVSALRLATAGAIAAGPVVFERLDFRPLRISPLLPIAATQPRGEATRLDSLRGRLAADLRQRLTLADEDRGLAEALDRWELSLFAEEPFRSGQVRDALTALLGGEEGAWAAAMRAAVLLGEDTKDRAELLDELRADHAGKRARDAVRRILVETLLHGSRVQLVRTLDETLLGLRPRPATVLAAA
jgi:hypothetical protein